MAAVALLELEQTRYSCLDLGIGGSWWLRRQSVDLNRITRSVRSLRLSQYYRSGDGSSQWRGCDAFIFVAGRRVVHAQCVHGNSVEMMVTNPIDRLHEQRAQRLLTALQDDLRAQMRLEDDEAGRRGRHDPPRSAQQKLQRKIARLADPATREKVWNRVVVPQFQATPINDLPKTREFWTQVDVTPWTKQQLDVACELLDLPPGGKKAEMVARIQDWVHAPEIRARREHMELLEREQERVLASGRVFAWGHNFNGELGLGDRKERRVPAEIERFRGEGITRVVSGIDADFALAIASDGRVFAWGGGGKSLVDEASRDSSKHESRPPLTASKAPPFQKQHPAEPTSTDSSSCFLIPREVRQLQHKTVASIVCVRSAGHIVLTTAEAACYSWGRNDHGELGVDMGDAKAMALVDALLPAPVTGFNTQGPPRIVQVSVGNSHTAALTHDGDLFMWGACWSGQLGLGVNKRKGVRNYRQQLFFPSPTPVEAFEKTRIVKVSCGAVHTAVLSAAGQLFTFGCGDGGRLGHGHVNTASENTANTSTDQNFDVLHPELVKALEKDVVVDVVCSSWHSLCLVRTRGDTFAKPDEGFVFAFGHGLHGQLGLGKQKMAAIPTRIPEFVHRKLRCRVLAVSSHHSCALSSDGKLFTWGQNTSGCLGRELPDGAVDATEPDVVTDFSGFGVGPVISIACGYRFTLMATGPWEPLEPAPQYESNERLNRHVKVPVSATTTTTGRSKSPTRSTRFAA